MNDVNALRQRRAALAKEAQNLLDNNPGTLWTAKQTKQYDEKIDAINRADAEIARIQKLADLSAEIALGDAIAHAKKKGVRYEPLSADGVFNTYVRGGESALSAEQIAISNTMSTTTGSQGGFAVPSLVASRLYDSMKAYGAMRGVAEILQTEDGKTLAYPASDGTAETGEWLAQNVTATAADPSFNTATLNVFKGSSQFVTVPIELLQDSMINIEGLVVNRLAARLGRLGNTAFTVGTGTTQPDGIVPKASVGKVGQTGQTLTIIYDDLVDIVHSIDPAYRSTGCGFMTSDSMLKVLRKLKDSGGRPLWTPSYDGGIQVGVNNKPNTNSGGDGGYSSQSQAKVFDYLLGYPMWVNNDIAVPAVSAKSLIFGNFSYYKIRDALDVEMYRFTDSAFAKLGQVGFLALCRMGGNLLDAKAVVYYQHSST